MCFYGGHSTGYKLGNHPKNIEPCAHRARTVRAPCAHRATTPPLGGGSPRGLRYLMALNPQPPRQTPEIWKEWTRLIIPAEDITFIDQALWRKLPAGVRLAGWQPRGTACPIDGQQEAIEHAIAHCKFLPTAFHLARQCMGPVLRDAGSTDDPEDILLSMPSLSLPPPLGLVMWSTIRASWRMRCSQILTWLPPTPLEMLPQFVECCP